MTNLLLPLALIVVATAQVTVAPLFPLAMAQVDLLLVTLALVTAFLGRRAAMISTPLLALFLAFLSGRSIGLLVLAFVPYPLLAYWLDESGPPMTRFLQTLAAVAVTGAWARMLLSIAAVAGGASFDPVAMVFLYVLPGLLLDSLLLSGLYLPCRMFGFEPVDLAPVRRRYRV